NSPLLIWVWLPLIRNGRFLMRNRLSRMRNRPFLIRGSLALMRKSRFLFGDLAPLVGESTLIWVNRGRLARRVRAASRPCMASMVTRSATFYKYCWRTMYLSVLLRRYMDTMVFFPP